MSLRRLCAASFTRWILPGMMIFLWAVSPVTGLAQCGDSPPDSSCSTCHQEAYPVSSKGEWHEIHAEKDCCWNCHGGNTQADDKDLAHEGMIRQPLEDTYTDCYACHPYDYETRAGRFGEVLGVIPVSHAPTPQPTIPAELNEDLQLIILPASESGSDQQVPRHPELICLALAAILFSGFLLWNKTHLQHIQP